MGSSAPWSNHEQQAFNDALAGLLAGKNQLKPLELAQAMWIAGRAYGYSQLLLGYDKPWVIPPVDLLQMAAKTATKWSEEWGPGAAGHGFDGKCPAYGTGYVQNSFKFELIVNKNRLLV